MVRKSFDPAYIFRKFCPKKYTLKLARACSEFMRCSVEVQGIEVQGIEVQGIEEPAARAARR